MGADDGDIQRRAVRKGVLPLLVTARFMALVIKRTVGVAVSPAVRPFFPLGPFSETHMNSMSMAWDLTPSLMNSPGISGTKWLLIPWKRSMGATSRSSVVLL